MNLTSVRPTNKVDALAVAALDLMRSKNISQLLVTDENEGYLGMVHLHDLVREGLV